MAIYKFMSKAVEENVKSFAKDLYNNSMATINALVMGYTYWIEYVRTQNIRELNQALYRTEWAYP